MQYCAGIEVVIEASWREHIKSEIRDRHDNEEHGLKTKQDCLIYFLTTCASEYCVTGGQ